MTSSTPEKNLSNVSKWIKEGVIVLKGSMLKCKLHGADDISNVNIKEK
jgi:hypothetical protein